MKLNFKKISAIAGSVLMTGLTIGTAAAASFPAPFVQSGTANVALVYGASSTDMPAVTSIKTKLDSVMPGTGPVVIEGDSYKIELGSTKFQLGKGVTDIVSGTVTDDHLETLLADGVYKDVNNNEKKYSQKLTLANWSLGMFDDSDYQKDTPTIGVKIGSGDTVLTYTLDFTDLPEFNKMATTDLVLMGKPYYILSVGSNNDTLTLLDSADSALLSEGETKTISLDGKSYQVSIAFIGNDQVKLTVNGETTNTMTSTASTYKLSDGTYVGVKDILYTSKESGSSKVEFSLGAGKLILTNGNDVEMNDNSISRLKAYIDNSTGSLDKIRIVWSADGDLFVAPNSSPVMPGFGSVSLVWGGMNYPTEEIISLEAGSNSYFTLKDFPLKDGASDINVIYGNSTNYTGVGKDSDEILRTVGSGNLTFSEETDDYFVASWTDGAANAESYLMRARNFRVVSSENRTTLEYKKDGSWVSAKTDAKVGDQVTLGSVVLTVGNINYDSRTVVIQPAATVNFNTLYSKEGMKVYLPWTNTTAVTIPSGTNTTTPCATAISESLITTSMVAGQLAYSHLVTYQNNTSGDGALTATCSNYPATYTLNFQEENKNGNVGASNPVNLTLGFNGASTPEVSVTNIAGNGVAFAEQGSSKIWESHVYSPLATKIIWDKSGDQYEVQLTYNGAESYGEVFVASADATSTTGNPLGNVIYKDTEVTDTVKAKNLIVVGGSCINSVAADLLGGAYCGSAFTTATGISNGEALLKAYPNKYTNGKVVVLVAGYEAADTQMGATYLINKNVDTSTVSSKVTTVTNAVDHALPA